MKILITGAKGLLGSELVKVLKKFGHKIYPCSSKDMDITKPEQVKSVLEAKKPELIIHSAAYTDVDGCEQNTEKAFQVNGMGTKNIAEIVEELEIPILYISTDYVFDGKNLIPYRESDPVDPINVYGMSKLMGERYIMKHTLKYYIVRSSGLYGENGKNFVDTILNKTKKEKELQVVNDQISVPTWSRDLSEGIARLILTGDYGIYHITNDGECSWYECARSIIKITGCNDVTVKPVTSNEYKRPAKRPAYSKLNNAAFENTTGYKLQHWENAIKEYLSTKNN